MGMDPAQEEHKQSSIPLVQDRNVILRVHIEIRNELDVCAWL